MKAICSKFLIVGLLAISSQLAFANNKVNTTIISTSVLRNMITKNVNDIIDEQVSKGYLTEKAPTSVTVLEPLKINFSPLLNINQSKQVSNGYTLTVTPILSSVSGNRMHIKMNQSTHCDISLVYDDKGGIEPLTNNTQLLLNTSFQNAEQKKMAQQFVALHEQFHCEFNKIDIPVLIDNHNRENNALLNHALRDQKSSFKESVTYFDMLNENFADTAAAMVLLQKYSKNNKNLLYVLDVIRTQRHDAYFKDNQATHFTHFSLDEVLKDKTLQNISNKLNTDKFQELALIIANKGVMQVLINRPVIADRVFYHENIYNGIVYSMYHNIQYSNASPEFKPTIITNLWGKDVQQGLSVDLAKELLKHEDLTNISFFEPNGNVKTTNTMDFFDKNNNLKKSTTIYGYIHQVITHDIIIDYIEKNDNIHSDLINLYKKSLLALQNTALNIKNSTDMSSFDYIDNDTSLHDISVKKNIILKQFINRRDNKLLNELSSSHKVSKSFKR